MKRFIQFVAFVFGGCALGAFIEATIGEGILLGAVLGGGIASAMFGIVFPKRLVSPRATASPPRRVDLIYRVSRIVWAMLAVPALLYALATPFMSQSWSIPARFIGFVLYTSMSLPLVIVVSVVVAQTLYARRHFVAATWVSLTPLPILGILAVALPLAHF